MDEIDRRLKKAKVDAEDLLKRSKQEQMELMKLMAMHQITDEIIYARPGMVRVGKTTTATLDENGKLRKVLYDVGQHLLKVLKTDWEFRIFFNHDETPEEIEKRTRLFFQSIKIPLKNAVIRDFLLVVIDSLEE